MSARAMGITVALSLGAVVVAIVWWRAAGMATTPPSPLPSAVTHVETAVQPVHDAVRAEVVRNILAQPIGGDTLRAFDLPAAFVDRIADRIIVSSYRDRFHRIEGDDQLPVPQSAPPAPPDGPWTLHESTIAEDIVEERRRLPELHPGRRGFRAIAGEAWTPSLGEFDDDDLRVARLVSGRLAVDGLLATTVAAIDMLGAKRSPSELAAQLGALGVPVDLLDHFVVQDAAPAVEHAVITYASRALASGSPIADVQDAVAASKFAFRPTVAGFSVATESGEHPIASMRLQLTRGTHWRGEGDGGSLDVARQLVEQLPDVRFAISIEARHVDDLCGTMSTWSLTPGREVKILAEPLIVSQWAQDNGKAGLLADGRTAALLAPRYASRRDDGSVFVAGESSLLEGLEAAGLAVIDSPLVFQGGNMLAVRDPSDGSRLLLVGEAEVARNTALGLRRDQVLEAFTIEFGVDRCAVLTTPSFHLDFDVSVRAVDDELVAFVNDVDAARDLVLAIGARALVRCELLDEAAVTDAVTALHAGDGLGYLQAIGAPVLGARGPGGLFPSDLAECFAEGEGDSAIGNFQRFLIAIDLLVAAIGGDASLPPDHPALGYYRALRRHADARTALHEELARTGFRVVPVPSLSAAARSLTAINGLHEFQRWIMPAYGGLYAPLDDAAATVFRRVLGPQVDVLAILSGESQRRAGAIHCSVAVWPDTTRP